MTYKIQEVVIWPWGKKGHTERPWEEAKQPSTSLRVDPQVTTPSGLSTSNPVTTGLTFPVVPKLPHCLLCTWKNRTGPTAPYQYHFSASTYKVTYKHLPTNHQNKKIRILCVTKILLVAHCTYHVKIYMTVYFHRNACHTIGLSAGKHHAISRNFWPTSHQLGGAGALVFTSPFSYTSRGMKHVCIFEAWWQGCTWHLNSQGWGNL